jgi:hypothetical protein
VVLGHVLHHAVQVPGHLLVRELLAQGPRASPARERNMILSISRLFSLTSFCRSRNWRKISSISFLSEA